MAAETALHHDEPVAEHDAEFMAAVEKLIEAVPVSQRSAVVAYLEPLVAQRAYMRVPAVQDTREIAEGLIASMTTPRTHEPLRDRGRTNVREVVQAISGVKASRKISVSLPADLEDELRDRAGAGNVSPYIAAAVRHQLEQDRLADLVSWLDETYGAVPEESIARAEALWPRVEE